MGSVETQSDAGATGVYARAEGSNATIAVSIGKNVTGSSTDPLKGIVGVQMEADNGGKGVASVGGDVKVDAAGNSNGIVALVSGSGDATINVGGSVMTDGAHGFGVSAALYEINDNAKTTISVEEDVQGVNAGLCVEVTGDQTSAAIADITVGGTLSAIDKNGAAIMVSEQVTEDNLKLTVWQIDLNANGDAVVERKPVKDADSGKIVNWEPIEITEKTKAIEQSINYIIKIEQPNAGATLTALKSDGSALEKSGEYEVAKEGETVLMKVNVQDGYEVTGAFNGLGEKVELLRDGEGNYYVVVPKGGAVYLSATVDAIPQNVVESPAEQNTEQDEAKATQDIIVVQTNATAVAIKAEGETVKTVSEAVATNEKGETVIIAIGTLDEKTATETMKVDYKNLEIALVNAKNNLDNYAQAVIPAELKSEVTEGVSIVASQPFRSVASEYPATFTVKLDNVDSFVGMMVFVNGKWVKLDTVINADGTVTYVLTEPSILSIVLQG